MAQGGLVGEVLGLLSALLVLRAQVAVPSHLGAGRHLLNFAGPGPSIATTANARLGRGHRLDVASLLFRVKQVGKVAADEIGQACRRKHACRHSRRKPVTLYGDQR